jgi:hypothetical protein
VSTTRRRAGLTLAISLIVLSPLARRKGWDDFPLSSYPMFSRSDVGGLQALAHVLVVHADGRRTPARPIEIGTPEPMVANAVAVHAITDGRSEELCAEIAKNVRDGDAVRVEVVVSEYDVKKYFVEGPREPRARVVYASCAVKR